MQPDQDPMRGETMEATYTTSAAHRRLLALRNDLSEVWDRAGRSAVFAVARKLGPLHGVTEPRELMLVVWSLACAREDAHSEASAIASYATTLLPDYPPQPPLGTEEREIGRAH